MNKSIGLSLKSKTKPIQKNFPGFRLKNALFLLRTVCAIPLFVLRRIKTVITFAWNAEAVK